MSISLQLRCVHEPMRAVLDTGVMVAGIGRATGASRKRLHLVETGRFGAVLSVAVVLEYESVLKRNEHLTATGLTTGDRDELSDGIL